MMLPMLPRVRECRRKGRPYLSSTCPREVTTVTSGFASRRLGAGAGSQGGGQRGAVSAKGGPAVPPPLPAAGSALLGPPGGLSVRAKAARFPASYGSGDSGNRSELDAFSFAMETAMIVNQTRLAELSGVTPKSLWLWARDEGMPVAARGENGAENQYDLVAVLAWACQRRASRTDGETQRDRLVRLQADKLEREEAVARKELIPVSEIEPAWTQMILAARAALLTLPDRVVPLIGADDAVRSVVYGAIEGEVESILRRLAAGEEASLPSPIEHATTAVAAPMKKE